MGGGYRNAKKYSHYQLWNKKSEIKHNRTEWEIKNENIIYECYNLVYGRVCNISQFHLFNFPYFPGHHI